MLSRNLATILLTLLCVSAAVARPNSAERARAFAALPNWTGIWQSAAWPLEVSGRPPGGEAQLMELLQLIRRPPYNTDWAAKYDAGLADVAAQARRRATFKACTRSFPALMEAPWMFEVAVLPEETLLIFENGQVRHIYTDGRQHPSGADLWPTFLGDSVGHWQGDTLIVDTIARTSSEPLAPRAWSAMLSDGAHFTERLRLVGSDLEDQLIIDDPLAFTGPWHITLRFKRAMAINRMLPYDCTENDRNPVVDGKLTISNP
jgi:hypothetical protein